MQYEDTIAEAQYSLAGWIKGFPRKFILTPDSQQIVRLTTQPPANLSDGMYWSRIITSAQPQAKRIDTVRTGITTQINIVFEQITTVLYAKGELNTDLEITDPFIVEDSTGVRLVWKTVKKGNAPYFGTANVKVFDEIGNVVDETVETLGIYATMNKKATFDRNKLKPGKYIAEIKFVTERNDIASDNIIQLPPIVKEDCIHDQVNGRPSLRQKICHYKCRCSLPALRQFSFSSKNGELCGRISRFYVAYFLRNNYLFFLHSHSRTISSIY